MTKTIGITALSLLWACAPAPDEQTGQVENAINAEAPGLAEMFGDDTGCPAGHCGYFADADRTFVSNSIARDSTAGCTGSWVGANIFMTAGHCAVTGAHQVAFMAYLDNSGFPAAFPIQCGEVLVQSIQDPQMGYSGAVDVALFYCPDVTINGLTLPPGIHFGTVDWDIRPTMAIGTPMYKLWWNPIDINGTTTNHLLYRTGTIVDNTQHHGWQNALRYDYSFCLNQGSSGSPSFSTEFHRILAGPHSIGGAPVSDPCTTAGQRSAVQSREVFDEWFVDEVNHWYHLNDSQILAAGLGPVAQYDGYQDKNHDFVFDIQHDLEAVRGERLRDHYWFGFESRPRNAQWSGVSNGTTFYPDGVIPPGPPFGVANYNRNPGGLVMHRAMKLDAYTTYRIALRSKSYWSSSTLGLKLAIVNADGRRTEQLLDTTGTQNKWHTFSLTTLNDPVGVQLVANGNINVDVWYLSVIKDGSAMDFDFADKREGWRNMNTGARAFIVPRGTGNNPDWAVVARRDLAIAAADDWGAGSQHLALVPNTTYNVCFSYRTDPASAGSNSSGRAELVTVGPPAGGPGTTLASRTFAPSAVWQRACFTGTTSPAIQTYLRFGNRTPVDRHNIYIDDIAITRP